MASGGISEQNATRAALGVAPENRVGKKHPDRFVSNAPWIGTWLAGWDVELAHQTATVTGGRSSMPRAVGCLT